MERGRRRSSVDVIVRRARARGQQALSEHDSKRIIAAYDVPIARERLVKSASEARDAARRIGYPVVLKACAAGESHKTEKGLVAVGLANDVELRRAFAALRERTGDGYAGDFLVQEMVRGSRELVIGMTRDPQFGPCVMFGLGGIFTEILGDVVFRVAPLEPGDALAMLDGIRARRILDAVRGLKAVDRDLLCQSLIGIGRIGLERPEIAQIDVNPLIVRDDRPVAVDALVMLSGAR
jgi:acetyl-CoA synthetase (ADP-forming)